MTTNMDLGDFTMMSHYIFHCADRGSARIDFLKEASSKILDFSGCDALELFVRDVDICYSWKITKSPEEYQFKLFGPEHAFQKDSGEFDKKGEVWQPCRDILQGDFNLSSPVIYQDGDIANFNGDNIPKPPPAAFQYPSIALLPFTIRKDNRGLLMLKTCSKNYFNSDNTAFFTAMAQTLGIAIANRRTQQDLRERIKEMRCMYGICQIVNIPDLPLKSVLRRIVMLLPPAMQYPELASACITFDCKTYKTPGFSRCRNTLSSDIILANNRRGSVKVCYKTHPDKRHIVEFLKEERSLLDSVAQNISLVIERKLAEEEKIKLQEQLRHADRLATIGQLSAGVAHEINEPLANILGFAQLASKEAVDDSQVKKDLERITAASLYAREIVRKLLIFARQVPTKKKQVRINDLLLDVISFFEFRLKNEGIKVQLNLQEDLPDIIADLSQVRQVFVNLLVNAMQAMPEGGTITFTTRSRDNLVVISFKDTGTGMSKKVIRQIFVPFFTTKKTGQGTGLGLPVVHGIVTSHGGRIDVQSRIGKGSTFQVFLPLENHTKADGEEDAKEK